jgi:hypothetical protein
MVSLLPRVQQKGPWAGVQVIKGKKFFQILNGL